MKLIINTDGGSRGNPGKGACAFVITDSDGKVVAEEGKYLGVCTNNEAEYEAVILALQLVANNLVEQLPEIVFKADSKLVVEQLSGRFKVKHPRIKLLYGAVKELEKKLNNVNYFYIPREENYQADRMVNQILDQQQR